MQIANFTFLFFAILLAIASGQLIYGTRKRRAQLIIPYLVVSMITMTIYLVRGIITYSHYEDLANLFITLVVVGIGIYFWICIFSFYQYLKYVNENENVPKDTVLMGDQMATEQGNA